MANEDFDPLAVKLAEEFNKTNGPEDDGVAHEAKKEILQRFRKALKEDDDDALSEAFSDLVDLKQGEPAKKLDS